MDPELKKALREAVGKKGDTELESTIGEYVDLLERDSYKASDGVNEFRKKAVESLSE